MKIIRWLLSHSLFILLIVAVIYAYMFWGNLLGEDTPAGKAVAYLSEEFVEVEEFVNAVKAKQAELSEEKASDQQASSTKTDDASVADAAEKTPLQTESVTTEEVAVKEADKKANKKEVIVNTAEAAATKPVNSQAASVAMSQAVSNTDTKADESNDAPVTQSAAAVNQAKDEPEQVNAAVSADTEAGSEVNNVQAALNHADKVFPAIAADSAKKETYVPAEVEQQLNKVGSSGEIIDGSQPGGKVREDWIAARSAFYQRNYELSEKSYQQVIDNTTDNFDAYGELGNVYFNQGKHKQAASAYFEAAAILVAKGQIYRARSLIGLLRHLDSSKADE